LVNAPELVLIDTMPPQKAMAYSACAIRVSSEITTPKPMAETATAARPNQSPAFQVVPLPPSVAR
jgi:hypothetical protein